MQMCEDRIKKLEQDLRESEKERQRYQNESNRVREMAQRNMISNRHAAQIGKYQEKAARFATIFYCQPNLTYI